MKIKLLLLFGLNLMTCLVSADHHESLETKKLNKELDGVLSKWTEAFNTQDIEKLVALYHENADVIYENGVQNRGKEDMKLYFLGQFENNPKLQEEITNVERRFLNSSVAIESGMWHRQGGADPTASTIGRYSCTLVKNDGQWQIIHDRAWSLPDKDSSGSKLKSRDKLSEYVIQYFNSAFSGSYKIANELLAKDVAVFINDIKIDGKENYIERLKKIQEELFKDIKFNELHVHTNYFSKNGHSWDGMTWQDVRPTPTIWSNAWADVLALGRNTGSEIKFRMHADFRWENNQIVEMLYYYDPSQLNKEMESQAAEID